ncbi:MAG: hypothetical protein WAM30_04385 [Candidatus Dormiibacterota bacterium]
MTTPAYQEEEKMDGKNGTERVDTRRIVDIARAAGYRGYLPIETLAPDGETYDPRAGAAELLQELRDAIR